MHALPLYELFAHTFVHLLSLFYRRCFLVSITCVFLFLLLFSLSITSFKTSLWNFHKFKKLVCLSLFLLCTFSYLCCACLSFFFLIEFSFLIYSHLFLNMFLFVLVLEWFSSVASIFHVSLFLRTLFGLIHGFSLLFYFLLLHTLFQKKTCCFWFGSVCTGSFSEKVCFLLVIPSKWEMFLCVFSFFLFLSSQKNLHFSLHFFQNKNFAGKTSCFWFIGPFFFSCFSFICFSCRSFFVWFFSISFATCFHFWNVFISSFCSSSFHLFSHFLSPLVFSFLSPSFSLFKLPFWVFWFSPCFLKSNSLCNKKSIFLGFCPDLLFLSSLFHQKKFVFPISFFVLFQKLCYLPMFGLFFCLEKWFLILYNSRFFCFIFWTLLLFFTLLFLMYPERRTFFLLENVGKRSIVFCFCPLGLKNIACEKKTVKFSSIFVFF